MRTLLYNLINHPDKYQLDTKSVFHIVDHTLHNYNGPAIEWADGRREWWIQGIQLDEESFNEVVSRIKHNYGNN